MNSAFNEISRQQKKLLKLLISIASIPSPTGLEQKKIQFIKKKINHFEKNVLIDNAGNLIVKLPSTSKTRAKKQY